MTIKIKTLISSKCLIAECPSYDEKNDLLYWVDMFRKNIFQYNFRNGEMSQHKVPKYVSYIVPTETLSTVIIGMQDGAYSYNFDDSTMIFLGGPINHDPLTYRFNDGKCDAAGRLWTGTTAFFEENSNSSLYEFSGGSDFKQMFHGVNVSNGLGWSPDSKSMYYTDSGKKLIYKFDFDLESGQISNKRILINFWNESGNPDGMAIDKNGNLWICHWGGYKISQWDPNNGKKLREIGIPAKQVTCPVFVGSDFSKLVVTTASYGCSEEELKENPGSGNLFILDADIDGLKTNFYRK